MQFSNDLTVWIGAFVTISILSFVFWNNSPLYKYVQTAFLGVAAGVTIVVGITNLKNQLTTHFSSGNYMMLIPIFLGLLLFVRYIPKLNWVARYPVAILVSGGAGLSLANTISAQFISQLKAGMRPLNSVDNVIMFAGLIAVIAFFFLTYKTTDTIERFKLGWLTKGGRIVLMIAFGASFGTAVMSRFSILISTMRFLLIDFMGL